MPPRFRRLFEGPDEIDYSPDPMGKIGEGARDIRDPPQDDHGQRLFQDFRDAFAQGRPLPELFGPGGTLELKQGIGLQSRNRRPDVAKVETFLDLLGEHDTAPTEGPTGYYSIRLEDNLKAYQARNGLKPDGVDNPQGETLGRIKQDLTRKLGPAALKPPRPAAPRPAAPRARTAGASAVPRSLQGEVLKGPLDGAVQSEPGKSRLGILPSASNTSIGSAKKHEQDGSGRLLTPPPPVPEPAIPTAASGEDAERKLTPAPKAHRQINPLIVDYHNTWLAAQQRTSPHVVGVDGTYNYQRAPEAWQRYYKRYDKVYRDVFVVLLDPATGEPTVWLRNPEMRESGLLGISRVFTWLALPGKLTNAPKIAQGLEIGAKPVLAQRALFDLATFLRLADKPLKATTPEQYFGRKLWESFSPTMQALIRPRFPYFIGKGAEIRGGKVLDAAGLTVTHDGANLKFTVRINGQETNRYLDLLTDEQILQVFRGWLARPGSPTGLPAGIEVKFASSPVLKSQVAKDRALEKARDIVAAHIMRIPAHRVKRADVAEAINIWLKAKRGSSVLTGRQEMAFKILVTQLQRKRLPDGTALTLGQVFGLGLLLALKVQNQPLLPPPPVDVPPPLFDPDVA